MTYTKEKKRKQNKRLKKYFDSAHLYTTKAESFFKAIIITISWIGSLNIPIKDTDLSPEINVALYLFSLALIMEYVILVVIRKTFFSKIIPFIITIMSVFVFLVSTAILIGKPFNINWKILWVCTVIPQAIIWIDTIVIILAEPSTQIENNLKEVKIGNLDE